MKLKINKILTRFEASLLSLLAIGAFLFAGYVALRYIHQPLVDIHSFRQTQTALTSLWILREGWSFAYQTPVAGFPWAIPFEFPLYQAIVAAMTALTGFDLEAMGRLVSLTFLLGCAWPAFVISARLALPKSVPWVFCALLWTSPLSVYWGRTFMIETTATFFTLACIPYAIDVIRRVGGWRSATLFGIFAVTAVLQKATTAGPVLLFFCMATVFIYWRQSGLTYVTLKRLVTPLVVLGIPLLVGLAWARYTDVIKLQNSFGRQLTSAALNAWNFGTLSQKLDWNTWRLVVWERSVSGNAGGVVGLLLLALPWVAGREHRRFAWLALAALGLFLLPILIFTNLHVVHDYYQVACVVFLIAALSIIVGGWLPGFLGRQWSAPVVTLVLMGLNVAVFNSSYGLVAARSLDQIGGQSAKAYKIGRYLEEQTPANSGLVIFGQDWSSELAFHAQRKSITVPPWFTEYQNLWKHPEKFLGPLPVGAIVVCPSPGGFPGPADVNERITAEPGWRLVRMDDCQILLATVVKP